MKNKSKWKAVKNLSKDLLLALAEYSNGVCLDSRRRVYRRFYNLDEQYPKKSFADCLNGLKRRGYIESTCDKDGRTLYELTRKGEMEVKKCKIKQKIKNKKWDGKWRFIIFDIPENQRMLRDNFRRTLRFIGCVKWQQSVWATPFDIFDDLEILIPDIKTHNWIKLIEAQFIVGEEELKKIFKL